MKRLLKLNLFRKSFTVTLLIAFLFLGCHDNCKVTNTFVYFDPVYSTSADVKAAVSLQPTHPLTGLGKIYFKDGYLFLNEVGKGIHIVDNRNPSMPQPLSFLNIPGNYDLAISGNTLYADSYVDLVVFDISDLNSIKEVNRVERLFNNYTSMGMLVGSDKGILTDWVRKENVSVQQEDCSARYQPWGGILYKGGIAFESSLARSFDSKTAFVPSGSNSQTGISGSMARFTINGDHLYALDGANLDVVKVSSPKNPVATKEILISSDVETLFPHEDKLFFGTQSGMLIYDLKDEENPSLISRYAHVRSCDPVVVEGDHAYVTLRNGSMCGGFTNQLEVINISNLKSPYVEKICPMTNPFGLGIDNGTLFICDGTSGMRVLDATDITKICESPLAHYEGIHALDIIPFQKVAMMIGNDGLYQYDYSNLKEIKLLSVLPIKQ
jgi:hypothetical protein